MLDHTANVATESHDQFVQRAGRVFPPERVRHWSRVERAVFNTLMSQLIFRHGYAAITESMLADSRANMEEIVRRYAKTFGRGALAE